MRVSTVPKSVRTFIERRLLCVEPVCESFWLTYLNDGSPLRTVAVPQGGRIEKVIDQLFDELAEAATAHAETSDGMHRFSIEAKGPAPERRSLGTQPFQLTTSGAGEVGFAYAKQLPESSPFEQPHFSLSQAASTVDSLEGADKMRELAHPFEAMQKASGASVPAATLKVGLDFAHGMGRLVIEEFPKMLRLQNDFIKQMGEQMQDMRQADIDARKLLGEMLTARDERKMKMRLELRREARAAKRMVKLTRMAEGIVPVMLEHFSGDSLVLQLIKELSPEQLQLVMQTISPRGRKIIQTIMDRAKAREEKIKGKKAKAKEPAPKKKAAA